MEYGLWSLPLTKLAALPPVTDPFATTVFAPVATMPDVSVRLPVTVRFPPSVTAPPARVAVPATLIAPDEVNAAVPLMARFPLTVSAGIDLMPLPVRVRLLTVAGRPLPALWAEPS